MIFKLFLILTAQGHFETCKDSTNICPLNPLRKLLDDEQQQKENKTDREVVRYRKQ